jgi:hypothetical protein
MSEEYGGWEDWLLCFWVAGLLLLGVFVHRFLERIRTLFASLSPLRKAVGALSLSLQFLTWSASVSANRRPSL